MNLKKKNGITLIALVVTIIVLLILAGVSISMLTGQNGILNRAAEAKEKTEIASKDERRKLAQEEALMNTEKTTYKGITLPEGFAPTKIDGEDSIDDGLVITDVYGNEYVWIEVPKTATVYPTAGVSISSFTDEEYTKIEEDLHKYTNDYRNGTSYRDVYYADSTTGWFTDADQYTRLKQKMLKSVYQNGGFWVGRYEAGIEENRTASGTATITPLSKENLYPYTYVTRTQAKVLAGQVESGSYTSSLMFGVQWDLILKYIETKNATTQYNLKTESKTIGNYNNNLWNITNANAKYSANYGSSFTACPKQKLENASILLTTGANKSFSLMNIYDLAGNVWEWTLEKTFDDSSPCTGRGGSYYNLGSNNPASHRDDRSMFASANDLGFRLSLY